MATLDTANVDMLWSAVGIVAVASLSRTLSLESNMREVQGYLTDDNTFFETVQEAERHEAIRTLHDAYKQFVGHKGNFDRFSNVIVNLAPEIRRFLNAIEGPERKESDIAETELATIERDQLAARKTKADLYTADDGTGEAFESLLQQPTGGPMSMSDVGDSPLAEKVRRSFKVDGP